MSIKFTEGIDKDNILLLCKWSNERGEIFQEQWMGTEVSFPLTYEKIEKLENKFSIFNEEEFVKTDLKLNRGKVCIYQNIGEILSVVLMTA